MARKVLSRGEWVIIIIISIVLLTFGLNKCGVGVIKTTEDAEMIDRPHN